MRYSPSRARRDFETWLSKALTLVVEARQQAGKNSIVRDSILCASIFLTHARFENYFMDVVSFAVTKLNEKNLACKSLPGRLRAAHLLSQMPHPALKRYYIQSDEKALLDDLHDKVGKADWAWGSSNHKGSLDVSVIMGSNGYPSSDNLKKVFHKLGVQIFDECGRRMRTDVKALIDGIGDLRNEMAHLGLPPAMTEQDVEMKLKDLGRTVEAIDRAVHERLRAPRSFTSNTPRDRKVQKSKAKST